MKLNNKYLGKPYLASIMKIINESKKNLYTGMIVHDDLPTQGSRTLQYFKGKKDHYYYRVGVTCSLSDVFEDLADHLGILNFDYQKNPEVLQKEICSKLEQCQKRTLIVISRPDRGNLSQLSFLIGLVIALENHICFVFLFTRAALEQLAQKKNKTILLLAKLTKLKYEI